LKGHVHPYISVRYEDIDEAFAEAHSMVDPNPHV
jgi:hypothetical protein